MNEPNWKNRTLFHGDNLDFLRAMNSESVDLIATDPPFNKGRGLPRHARQPSLGSQVPRPLVLGEGRASGVGGPDRGRPQAPDGSHRERPPCPFGRHGCVHALHGGEAAGHAEGAESHRQHLPALRSDRQPPPESHHGCDIRLEGFSQRNRVETYSFSRQQQIAGEATSKGPRHRFVPCEWNAEHMERAHRAI